MNVNEKDEIIKHALYEVESALELLIGQKESWSIRKLKLLKAILKGEYL